jgi:hypothetical protein
LAHLTFTVLHVLAVLFFWPGVFLTVPLHLIYSAMPNRPSEPIAAPGKDEPRHPLLHTLWVAAAVTAIVMLVNHLKS